MASLYCRKTRKRAINDRPGALLIANKEINVKILRAAFKGENFYAELKGDKALRLADAPYEKISYTGDEYMIGELELLAHPSLRKLSRLALTTRSTRER